MGAQYDMSPGKIKARYFYFLFVSQRSYLLIAEKQNFQSKLATCNYWLLAITYILLLLGTTCSNKLLAICNLKLLAIVYFPLTTFLYYLILSTCYCFLLAICYLFITFCLLISTHYLLLATY